MKLKDIAERLGCRLRGDGSIEIAGPAGIEDAAPDEITFLSNPKYAPKIKNSKAGAIILGPSAPETEIPALISDNPYLTFSKVIELFYEPPEPIPGIHPTAVIDDTAELGEDYSIGAHAVIGPFAKLGRRATLHPHVVIYPYAEIGEDFTAHSHATVREYCRIGDRVILQNGAVVGCDGFGFAPEGEGRYHKIVQSGSVILEDDVEVGAHTCIDRATVGETRIGRGTKIDNLVQIGHGSQVGEDCVLAAQVGLAGSTKVGKRVMLGGQVGVAGHLTLGDGVIATARTGIARSVEPGRKISGAPEMDTALWRKNYLLMLRFPELVKTIRQLEARVAKLEGKQD